MSLNIINNLCTKQENWGLKSAVYNQEGFQIKSGLLWPLYDIGFIEFFDISSQSTELPQI